MDTQDEAGVWEQRLAVLAEGLQTLNAIQRKWVYLEPIFARGALPNEQPRFRRVSVHFLTEHAPLLRGVVPGKQAVSCQPCLPAKLPSRLLETAMTVVMQL